MGVDLIGNDTYITCIYSDDDPYGRMVNTYRTLEEAQSHIKYQKELFPSRNVTWNILHIKEVEWIQ